MAAAHDRTVVLDDAEAYIATWVGEQRQASNDRARVRDGRIDPNRSSSALHVHGFGGELAFCKLFNVYPDFTIGPRRGGADCERFGQAIDVKSTEHVRGHLLAVTSKSVLAADVYALMIDNWPAFRFVGFAPAADLLRDGARKNMGHAVGYALEQNDLKAGQLPFYFERRRNGGAP